MGKGQKEGMTTGKENEEEDETEENGKRGRQRCYGKQR